MGKWKAIRTDLAKGPSPLQLYDLEADLAETRNIASENRDVVAKIEKIMAENHRRSELFPIKGLDGDGK